MKNKTSLKILATILSVLVCFQFPVPVFADEPPNNNNNFQTPPSVPITNPSPTTPTANPPSTPPAQGPGNSLGSQGPLAPIAPAPSPVTPNTTDASIEEYELRLQNPESELSEDDELLAWLQSLEEDEFDDLLGIDLEAEQTRARELLNLWLGRLRGSVTEENWLSAWNDRPLVDTPTPDPLPTSYSFTASNGRTYRGQLTLYPGTRNVMQPGVAGRFIAHSDNYGLLWDARGRSFERVDSGDTSTIYSRDPGSTWTRITGRAERGLDSTSVALEGINGNVIADPAQPFWRGFVAETEYRRDGSQIHYISLPVNGTTTTYQAVRVNPTGAVQVDLSVLRLATTDQTRMDVARQLAGILAQVAGNRMIAGVDSEPQLRGIGQAGYNQLTVAQRQQFLVTPLRRWLFDLASMPNEINASTRLVVGNHGEMMVGQITQQSPGLIGSLLGQTQPTFTFTPAWTGRFAPRNYSLGTFDLTENSNVPNSPYQASDSPFLNSPLTVWQHNGHVLPTPPQPTSEWTEYLPNEASIVHRFRSRPGDLFGRAGFDHTVNYLIPRFLGSNSGIWLTYRQRTLPPINIDGTSGVAGLARGIGNAPVLGPGLQWFGWGVSSLAWNGPSLIGTTTAAATGDANALLYSANYFLRIYMTPAARPGIDAALRNNQVPEVLQTVLANLRRTNSDTNMILDMMVRDARSAESRRRIARGEPGLLESQIVASVSEVDRARILLGYTYSAVQNTLVNEGMGNGSFVDNSIIFGAPVIEQGSQLVGMVGAFRALNQLAQMGRAAQALNVIFQGYGMVSFGASIPASVEELVHAIGEGDRTRIAQLIPEVISNLVLAFVTASHVYEYLQTRNSGSNSSNRTLTPEELARLRAEAEAEVARIRNQPGGGVIEHGPPGTRAGGRAGSLNLMPLLDAVSGLWRRIFGPNTGTSQGTPPSATPVIPGSERAFANGHRRTYKPPQGETRFSEFTVERQGENWIVNGQRVMPNPDANGITRVWLVNGRPVALNPMATGQPPFVIEFQGNTMRLRGRGELINLRNLPNNQPSDTILVLPQPQAQNLPRVPIPAAGRTIGRTADTNGSRIQVGETTFDIFWPPNSNPNGPIQIFIHYPTGTGTVPASLPRGQEFSIGVGSRVLVNRVGSPRRIGEPSNAPNISIQDPSLPNDARFGIRYNPDGTVTITPTQGPAPTFQPAGSSPAPVQPPSQTTPPRQIPPATQPTTPPAGRPVQVLAPNPNQVATARLAGNSVPIDFGNGLVGELRLPRVGESLTGAIFTLPGEPPIQIPLGSTRNVGPGGNLSISLAPINGIPVFSFRNRGSAPVTVTGIVVDRVVTLPAQGTTTPSTPSNGGTPNPPGVTTRMPGVRGGLPNSRPGTLNVGPLLDLLGRAWNKFFGPRPTTTVNPPSASSPLNLNYLNPAERAFVEWLRGDRRGPAPEIPPSAREAVPALIEGQRNFIPTAEAPFPGGRRGETPDIAAVLARRKPAAILSDTVTPEGRALLAEAINQGLVVVVIPSPVNRLPLVIVADTPARANAIAALLRTPAAEAGPNYHYELGRLLGYPEAALRAFHNQTFPGQPFPGDAPSAPPANSSTGPSLLDNPMLNSILGRRIQAAREAGIPLDQVPGLGRRLPNSENVSSLPPIPVPNQPSAPIQLQPGMNSISRPPAGGSTTVQQPGGAQYVITRSPDGRFLTIERIGPNGQRQPLFTANNNASAFQLGDFTFDFSSPGTIRINNRGPNPTTPSTTTPPPNNSAPTTPTRQPSAPRTPATDALQHNLERLNSTEFNDVMLRESVGDNAGANHRAVNIVVDSTGRIVYIGNYPPSQMQTGINTGALHEVSLRTDLAGFINAGRSLVADPRHLGQSRGLESLPATVRENLLQAISEYNRTRPPMTPEERALYERIYGTPPPTFSGQPSTSGTPPTPPPPATPPTAPAGTSTTPVNSSSLGGEQGPVTVGGPGLAGMVAAVTLPLTVGQVPPNQANPPMMQQPPVVTLPGNANMQPPPAVTLPGNLNQAPNPVTLLPATNVPSSPTPEQMAQMMEYAKQMQAAMANQQAQIPTPPVMILDMIAAAKQGLTTLVQGSTMLSPESKQDFLDQIAGIQTMDDAQRIYGQISNPPQVSAPATSLVKNPSQTAEPTIQTAPFIPGVTPTGTNQAGPYIPGVTPTGENQFALQIGEPNTVVTPLPAANVPSSPTPEQMAQMAAQAEQMAKATMANPPMMQQPPVVTLPGNANMQPPPVVTLPGNLNQAQNPVTLLPASMGPTQTPTPEQMAQMMDYAKQMQPAMANQPIYTPNPAMGPEALRQYEEYMRKMYEQYYASLPPFFVPPLQVSNPVNMPDMVAAAKQGLTTLVQESTAMDSNSKQDFLARIPQIRTVEEAGAIHQEITQTPRSAVYIPPCPSPSYTSSFSSIAQLKCSAPSSQSQLS